MRPWLRVLVFACLSIAGCGDDDGTRRPHDDSGVRCDGAPRIGCACRHGDEACSTLDGDLYCASVWVRAELPSCRGTDAGAGADSDAGSAADSGSASGVGADSDAGADSDSGSASDSGAASDSGSDAGPPPAMATHCVDIDVSNTCAMSVSPGEITIPAGQTAYFCWRNRSRDYPIEVWLSYGGGYTDLAPGATWNEPVGHCLGPNARTEYADISTACSEHRFLIHCL